MDKILSEALGFDLQEDDIRFIDSEKNIYVSTIEAADVVLIEKGVYEAIRLAAVHEVGFRRVQRERANASRGLTPKKVRKGYILKSWREKQSKTARGWTVSFTEVIMQTPWTVRDYPNPAEVKQLVVSDRLHELFLSGGELDNFSYCESLNTSSNRCIVAPAVTYSGGDYWNVELKLFGGDFAVPREIIP